MQTTGKLSLSLKLALWLASTGLIIILLSSIFEFTSETKRIKTSINTKLETITKRTISSIKLSVYGFDLQGIKEIILSEFASEDLASIHVWSYPDNELLCGIVLKDEILVDLPTPSKGPDIISKEDIITINQSIHKSESKKIGTIKVSYNISKSRKRLINRMIFSIMRSSLMVILLILILFIISSNLLVSPLEKIINTITDIEKGVLGKEDINSWNPSTSIESLNKMNFIFPELKSLSLGLSRMVKTIKDGQTNIEKSEENLRITLNSIGDAVIATDEESKITQMNPVAEELTGWSLKDAKNEKLENVFHIVNAFSMERMESPVKKVLQSCKTVGLANHTILISRDKTEKHIADSGAPIRDKAGNILGVVLVFRDITERYKLEEQVRQSQKMDSIGQLAGGVAHDFNNMLAGIIGAADELNDLLTTDKEKQIYTNLILSAADRATDLTKQLLAFSRKGTVNETIFMVNKPINDSILLLKRSIDPKIKINLEFSNKDIFVKGDMSQFQNVIMNLCINARDAMPNGGTLKVITEEKVVDSSFLSHSGVQINKGTYALISVIDSGIGIDPKSAKHIFEPFFTTKLVGEGTGLGLAAVYGTIKEFNGFIDFESKQGKGTSFYLYIPESDKSQDEFTKNRPIPQKGKGTVLIIDDEEIIRNMAKNLLASIGYDSILAVNGEDGIMKYKENMKNINLVLLDMLMPIMNGKETFKQLKKINSDVKVLLSSGYISDKEIKSLLEEGAKSFIHKPYKKSELAEEIFKII